MSKQLGFFSVLVLLFLIGCGQAAKSIPPVSSTPLQSASSILETSATPSKVVTPTRTVIHTPTPIVVGPLVGGPAGTEGYPWWNDTVFYEIFVRSFYDSDGNGIGDFNGVTAKLDYLKDLGITGIWLLPIYPITGPIGYNANDFYSVDPDYGSMDDFKRLLSEAHKRGMRVLMDGIFGYTSSTNPWFIASKDPNSLYRDWYYWSTDPSSNDWGLPTDLWGYQTWYETPSGYYYDRFDNPDYIDLNLHNPEVTDELYKVVRFWLQDMGVDGFRVDSASALVPEGSNLFDTPSTHAWLKVFYTFYKGINPNAFTVGEAWGEPASSLATYTGDQLDTTFEFNIAGAIIDSVTSGSNSKINAALQQATTIIPHQQFAPFITNHDMDRTMTMLNGDPEKAKAAASLLLTSPGALFIYFGEEIGMQGICRDANGMWHQLNMRYPMQWSSGTNAGFTVGQPWFPPDPNYVKFNVSDEMKDPASILSQFKALIGLRNTHPSLRIGSMNIVSSSDSGLFASLRVSSTEAVLVLINLTSTPINNFGLSLQKSPLQSGKYLALPLMGQGPVGDLNVTSTGGFSNYGPIPTIPAYATVIIQFNPK
jgi:alpha-amylase